MSKYRLFVLLNIQNKFLFYILSSQNNILKTSTNTYDPQNHSTPPPSHTHPIHNHPSYESVQLASEEVKRRGGKTFLMREEGKSWAARGVNLSNSCRLNTVLTYTHATDLIYKAGLISPKGNSHIDNWSGSPGDRQLTGEMMKSLWCNLLSLTCSHSKCKCFTTKNMYKNRATLLCWRCSHER